jgi:aspartate racemase
LRFGKNEERKLKMAKHIGIVGCSAEGAALCYRTICGEAPPLMGEHMHPEVSMHTHPLAEYMVPIRAGDWENVAALMLSSAEKVSQIGAEFAICPDNTIHEAFEFVKEKSPIPWLHIAEAVANKAIEEGFNQLAILGTKYLMTGPVYPVTLQKFDIASQIPEKDDRERIDEIIFKELVNGVEKLKSHGCDAAVLGCTEIPLLVDPDDCPLPVLDSTRLLSRAALNEALS